MRRRQDNARSEFTQTRLVTLKASSSCSGFFDAACYEFYLKRLCHSLNYFQVRLHAYALLPDRIWLLLTPQTVTGLCGLLHSVNASYVDYFNTRFARATNAWPRHFTQFTVTENATVLACQKLIERGPIQQALVTHAGVWRWSSYIANAFGDRSGFLTRHEAILEFLQQERDPGSRYRDYIGVSFATGCYDYLRRCIEPQTRFTKGARSTTCGARHIAQGY